MQSYYGAWGSLWLGLVLVGGAGAAAGAAPVSGTLELVRQSDFIGLAHVQPVVSAPQDEWRQIVSIHRAEALKGALKPDSERNGELPWVYALPARPGRYRAAFPRRGDYLLFLRRVQAREGERWLTTATFHVDYRPVAEGRIEGHIAAGNQHAQAMEVSSVRRLLRRVIAGRQTTLAARALDPLFRRASAFAARNPERPVPHEVRLREIVALARKVRRGTLRADVEKVFPEEDGGLSGPGSTRYYLGSEVMVEVPYVHARGTARVSGPLRVYRSLPHYD